MKTVKTALQMLAEIERGLVRLRKSPPWTARPLANTMLLKLERWRKKKRKTP